MSVLGFIIYSDCMFPHIYHITLTQALDLLATSLKIKLLASFPILDRIKSFPENLYLIIKLHDIEFLLLFNYKSTTSAYAASR